jgi:hypothetical protein
MRNQPPAFTGLPVNRLQSCREEEQAVRGRFAGDLGAVPAFFVDATMT